MNNNIEDMQVLMRKVFPDMDKCHMNGMLPAIGYGRNKVVVSILILADDLMIRDFMNDTEDKVSVKTSCFTRKNKSGMGQDLIIRLDFFCKTGQPTFEAVIASELKKRRKDLIKALKKVDELVVWVADKDRKVQKVMCVDWDYEIHKRILSQFE